MSLETSMADKHLVVVLGAGGVGKTTLAARLAESAARAGRTALALAVEDGGALRQRLGSAADGLALLSVPMVSARAAWEHALLQHAAAAHLWQNPLCQAIVDSFTGTQPYGLAAELVAQVDSLRPDLTVVDPAPDEDAIAFLDTAKRLRGFFEPALQRWLCTSYESEHGLGGASGWSMRYVFRRLEAAFGRAALANASAFFRDLTALAEPLLARAQLFERMLYAPSTAILIVTTPTQHGLAGVADLRLRLAAMDLAPAAVVVNRLTSAAALATVTERLPAGLLVYSDGTTLDRGCEARSF